MYDVFSCIRYERDLKKGQEKVDANQYVVDRLNKDLAKAVQLAGVSLQHLLLATMLFFGPLYHTKAY